MNGSWWQGTRLVAGRAVVENLRSKTFKIMTAVLLLISAAAVVVPSLLGQDGGRRTLVTQGEAPPALVALVDDGATAADLEVAYLAREDEAGVRRAVEDGDAHVGLAGDSLYTRADPADLFAALVSQSAMTLEITERLAQAGLDPDDIAEVHAVRPPDRVTVGGVVDVDRAGLGFILGVVLYLAVTFAGSAIATAVATEKATRISEVLLAVVRPSQVMVGTVLAVGLVTLAQLLILLVPVAIAAQLTDLGLPPVAGGDIALSLVWFLLGYLMYSFLFAAAGAVVNKANEVGMTITPITLVLVAGYMIGLLATTTDPDGPVSVVASMFPLSAPLVMPIRWAGGEVPVAQLMVSMALTAIAAALLAAFASTVYRRALLITGRRAKLREVVRPHPRQPVTRPAGL